MDNIFNYQLKAMGMIAKSLEEEVLEIKDDVILDAVDEALKGQDHDHDENCEPESCPDVKEM